MTDSRRTWRRALALAATVTALGGGSLALAMAGSAGAAAPAGGHAVTEHAHIIPQAPPSTSTSASAPSTAPSTPAAPSASKASRPTAAATGPVAPLQLAASQLPAVQAERWTAVATANTRTIAGHDIAENECAKVVGATTWTQQGFLGGDGQDPAAQDTFTFPNAASAHNAFTAFTSVMAACQATTRALQSSNQVAPDAVVRQTAVTSSATAWQRTWTGVMGMSAAAPQTNHYYLAVRGTRLIVLQFTEFSGQATAYDPAADPQVLAMLVTDLAK